MTQDYGNERLNQLAADIRAAHERGGDRAVVEMLRERIPQHTALSSEIQMSSFAGGFNRPANYFDIGAARVVNRDSLTDRDGAADGHTEAGEVISVFAASVLAGPEASPEATINLAESFSPYVCGCTAMPPSGSRFR